MNMECDVSIIIVNYNGKKYLSELIASLNSLDHSDFTYEVVFVDNASSDNSLEYLHALPYIDKLNLKIISSKLNLGFAAGNNLGVENASGKYIVFLNNDTKPQKDWLENLYHYINENQNIVMVNSKLIFYYDFLSLKFRTRDKITIKKQIKINGKEYEIESKFCKNCLYEPEYIVCFGNTEISIPLIDGISISYEIDIEVLHSIDDDETDVEGQLIPLGPYKTAKLFISEKVIKSKHYTLIQNAGSGINERFDGFDIGFCQRDCEKYMNPYEINNGCGASIICRKDDFVHNGGFDESYFMYYEDTDLSYRLKRSGGKIMYCPNSVVRHIHAGSSNEWSAFFVYYVYRNKLLFIKNNIGLKNFLHYFFIQLLEGIKERNIYKIRGTLHALIGRVGYQKIE